MPCHDRCLSCLCCCCCIQPPNGGSVKRKLSRLFTQGVLMDIKILKRCVKANVPPLTFQEAYGQHTRHHLWRKHIHSIVNGDMVLHPVRFHLTHSCVFAWHTFFDPCRALSELSGRIINIVVSPASGAGNKDTLRLLNYLTAPNVLVWSAALASCAIPGVYAPVELMKKDEETGLISPYLEGGAPIKVMETS
jgi:hypothetical protein